jgi:hypothetical protein
MSLKESTEKPKKYTFYTQEVNYLGMMICPGQVAMDPAKLSGISQWRDSLLY